MYSTSTTYRVRYGDNVEYCTVDVIVVSLTDINMYNMLLKYLKYIPSRMKSF